MPPLSLLIKPASGSCNLRCKYCFYHSVAENRNTKSYGMMKIDTLEVIVRKALQFADQVCTFAFQGGEPTLSGLDFFRKLIELQKKYKKTNVRINNAIQTNGVLINEQWAEFLSQNNFLVGISLDGPKDINDMNRYDVNGIGSFKEVMNAINLFNKHKVEYNILFVVNSSTARHINKIYNFFKQNDFGYLQFIPCLDPLDEQPGGREYSLTPKRFTLFLKTLFDLWYDDLINDKMISIRYFDNLVGMLMGHSPEACGMLGECMCQFVIEADGGVYPCDFYVTDKWHLGNITQTDLNDLKNCDTSKEFINVSKYIAPVCRTCKWFNLCRGGCRRTREPFVDGKPVLNYFCPSYIEFFNYSISRMQHLANMFSVRR